MNFLASPAAQWKFILAATQVASTERERGAIAAGPIEHLLGRHGDEYIEYVEEAAGQDVNFARTLNGVWKNMMTDAVFERVVAARRD